MDTQSATIQRRYDLDWLRLMIPYLVAVFTHVTLLLYPLLSFLLSMKLLPTSAALQPQGTRVSELLARCKPAGEIACV